MRFITSFNPAEGSGTIPVGAGDANQKVLLYNESAIKLQLDFDDGRSDVLHAWEAKYWVLPYPTYDIAWSVVSALNGAGQAPISEVDVILYEAGERIEGTFPCQLTRLVSQGNLIAVSSTATNLINDGNAANSQIIEATQTGSSGSNVSVDNSGNMAIKQYSGGTLTTLLQIIAGAGASAVNVKLSDSGHTTEVLGALQVDGTTTLSGTINGSQLQTIPGAANGAVNVQLSDANHVTEVVGDLQVDGNFTYNGGTRLPRAAIIYGTIPVFGVLTVTHNMGVVPDIVIPVYWNVGGQPSSPLAVSNVTSTQATILGQQGMPIAVLALKF